MRPGSENLKYAEFVWGVCARSKTDKSGYPDFWLASRRKDRAQRIHRNDIGRGALQPCGLSDVNKT
jgi:hypothetical protein